MATLAERLRAAMTEARKQKDPARTLLLSTILSDIKNREFELTGPATDDDVGAVLRRGIKQRREAAEQYGRGGRPELAERERAEVRMLEAFLPAGADEAEIRAAVREAVAGGAGDLGKVMGWVLPRFQGRADGSLVNRIAREELAASP